MSGTILELAEDANNWNEGEHPRDQGGKFSTSGSGGSPAEIEKQAQQNGHAVPTSSVKALLQKAGFQAHSAHNGLVYKHPGSGAMIKITKPGHVAGSQSAHWKLEHPDFIKGGKNAPPLAALLDKLIEGAKLSEAHPAVQKAAKNPINAAKPLVGFTPVETPSGTVVQKQELNLHEVLADKGYALNGKHSAAVKNSLIYEKPNGAKVQVWPTPGTWIAETPGHMTKTGNELTSLQALLTGAPGDYKNTTQKVAPMPQTPAATYPGLPGAAQQTDFEKQNSYEKILRNKLKEVSPHPDHSQLSAISHYTASSYSSINTALRQHKELSGNLKTVVENLNNYLTKAEIPEDCVVWRGIKSEHAGLIRAIIEKGAKYKEKGFMSSSVRKDFARDWAGHGGLLLKVNVKKGTKGAYVDQISSNHGESEVIFKSGHWVYVESFDPNNNYAEVTILEE